MLKALYDYGLRKQLVLPPGFAEKPIKAYISLSEHDDHVDIYPGNDKQGVMCPDVGRLSQSKDKSNIFAEKRSVVVPDAPTAKSGYFLEILRMASEQEPLLKTCVRALETPEIAADIRAKLDIEKIKPTDRISFRVDGRSILESENIRAWWQSYRQQISKSGDTASASAVCLITGEPTVPLETTAAIKGLHSVGGHANGDALICFDKASFCSYDQKKATNAPVSEEAFCMVKAALDDLLKDAPILAGMKFVHWFDREVPQEDDPLFSIDFGFDVQEAPGAKPEAGQDEQLTINELIERDKANRVPESVRSGQAAPDLDNASYYILLLSGVNGRVMIRKYERGCYADLRRSLKLWYSDLALTNQSGTGNIGGKKLTMRMKHLMKPQKNDKNISDRLSKELSGVTPAVIQAILTGGVLPDSVASKALAYIRSVLMGGADEGSKSRAPVLPDSVACQWLKAWLLRKNRMNKQEEQILEEYNMNLSDTAYHCGGLMAVYAAIQKAAMPDVNTGIVERYYASAIQTPALVIGQLSSRSNHHLEKITNKWLASEYRKKLCEVSVALGTHVPATLNLEQQSYFALGYYQMGAMLNREKNERYAAAKEKAEAATE